MLKNQQLIRDTQTTFKGPPTHIIRPPLKAILELETIQEVPDTEEEASMSTGDTKIEMEETNELPQRKQTEEILEIPALEKEMADELWQEVWDLKENEKETNTSAPISVVGHTDYMGMDKMSLTTDELRRDDDRMSEANTLATLPSFLGDYETKTEVIPIP